MKAVFKIMTDSNIAAPDGQRGTNTFKEVEISHLEIMAYAPTVSTGRSPGVCAIRVYCADGTQFMMQIECRGTILLPDRVGTINDKS